MSQEIADLNHELENANTFVDTVLNSLDPENGKADEMAARTLLGKEFCENHSQELEEFTSVLNSVASFYNQEIVRHQEGNRHLEAPDPQKSYSDELTLKGETFKDPEQFLNSAYHHATNYNLPEHVEANLEMLTLIPGDFISHKKQEQENITTQRLLKPFETYQKKMDEQIQVKNNAHGSEVDVDRGFRPALWTWAKNMYEHGQPPYQVFVEDFGDSTAIELENRKYSERPSKKGSGLNLVEELSQQYDVKMNVKESEKEYRGKFLI